MAARSLIAGASGRSQADSGNGIEPGIEVLAVVATRDSNNAPANRRSRMIATSVRRATQDLVVTRVDVDLDCQLLLHKSEIEPRRSVLGKVDPMLTHESVDAAVEKGERRAYLWVGVGGTASDPPLKLRDEVRCPGPLGREPRRGHVVELGDVDAVSAEHLLDDREQCVAIEPAGEVERGTGRRGDTNAVASPYDVVFVNCGGPVWHYPSRLGRLTPRRRNRMDSVVVGKSGEPPQPSGRRPGDGQVGSSEADSGATAELLEVHARRAVRPAQHGNQFSVLAQSTNLMSVESGRIQLRRTDDAMLIGE